MKFAFMKQRYEQSIRIRSMLGVGIAIGYCLMLQNTSVPSILPSASMWGRIALITTFEKEIIICKRGTWLHTT
jgi:hypothetical protein